MIFSAFLPVLQISSKTSFAIFPEIVPSLIFAIKLEKLSGVIFELPKDILFLFNNALTSPIIHLADSLGSQFLETSSKKLAVCLSAHITLAS